MRFNDPHDPFPPFSSPTPGQYGFLDRHRLRHDCTTDQYDATHAIDAYVRSQRLLEPTERQIRLLKAKGKFKPGMTRGEAFDAIRLLFG